MSPTKSTSQSSTSQCSKISRSMLSPRNSLITSTTSSSALPLNKSQKASSPLVSSTRGKPNDSGSSSTLLSSPSHSECSPLLSHPSSLNSPSQLLPTISSINTNQNFQRQSRKRIKIIPVCQISSYKKSRIFIDQRSVVSPPIDTHDRSNLDIHQKANYNSNSKKSIQNPSTTTEDKSQPCSSNIDCLSSLNTEEEVTPDTRKAHIENNVDDLMNELQASFNITRMVFNNHRRFVESKLDQMTQQCEKLSISLNNS